MSNIDFIYTDMPLKKSEYSIEDILGNGDSELKGIRFYDGDLSEQAAEAAGSLFPELNRYLVEHGFVNFEYNKHTPSDWKEWNKRFLEWFLDFIGEHLANGANKFYFARLWYTFDPDKKKPKMKKIDLYRFRPSEKEFDLGRYTIWEFTDTGIPSGRK